MNKELQHIDAEFRKADAAIDAEFRKADAAVSKLVHTAKLAGHCHNFYDLGNKVLGTSTGDILKAFTKERPDLAKDMMIDPHDLMLEGDVKFVLLRNMAEALNFIAGEMHSNIAEEVKACELPVDDFFVTMLTSLTELYLEGVMRLSAARMCEIRNAIVPSDPSSCSDCCGTTCTACEETPGPEYKGKVASEEVNETCCIPPQGKVAVLIKDGDTIRPVRFTAGEQGIEDNLFPHKPNTQAAPDNQVFVDMAMKALEEFLWSLREE